MLRDKIETTAQLRVFLADLMVRVRDGDVDAIQAREAVKVAEAINHSFDVELKLRLMETRTGDFVPRLGALRLGQCMAEPPETILIDGESSSV